MSATSEHRVAHRLAGHRRAPVHPAATLARRAVADRLGLSLVLALLMVGMGLMVGALWPPLRGVFDDLEQALPDLFTAFAGRSPLSTPQGWVNAEMFSMVAPAAAVAAGVVSATRASAGEEESGTLGLLLSVPVSRTTVLLAKAAAMVAHVLVVCAGVVLGLLAGSVVGGMGLGVGGVVAAGLHTAAVGVLFGALALLVAAATASRRASTAVSLAAATASFVVASFLPLYEPLAGAARWSPWHYLDAADPLVGGVDAGHLLGLAAGAGVLVALAATVFRRRDLRG